VCILCKSRGGRCIEQGSEDLSLSETKPSALRKRPVNEKESQSQTGISSDQSGKFCADAETSDLVLSERVNHAPIVTLLVDAKVNFKN
jgi:hypothetical protein